MQKSEGGEGAREEEKEKGDQMSSPGTMRIQSRPRYLIAALLSPGGSCRWLNGAEGHGRPGDSSQGGEALSVLRLEDKGRSQMGVKEARRRGESEGCPRGRRGGGEKKKNN